jgi:thioesterase domain-containing protein
LNRPAPRIKSVVPIRRQGTRIPFFCVTAGYGHVLALADFARECSADQPFYALQPPLEADLQGPRPGRDELIEEYRAAVREVQPRGPYVIGGCSSGGLLAVELARALQREGQRVALLVLLDSPHVISPLFWSCYRRFRRQLAFVLGLLAHGRWRRILLAKSFFIDEGFYTHLAALDRYEVGAYDAPILLFNSQRGLSFSASAPHWANIAKGEFTIHRVPVDHLMFLRPPHAAEVANLMQQAIDRTLERECVS